MRVNWVIIGLNNGSLLIRCDIITILVIADLSSAVNLPLTVVRDVAATLLSGSPFTHID